MNKEKNNAVVINMQMDHYACGYYRMLFPDMSLRAQSEMIYSSIRYDGPTTSLPKLNPNVIIKAQRFHSEKHARYFKAYLEQMRLRYNNKILYDIDDILIGPDMPIYNPSRENHMDTGQHLQLMLEVADVISVSTPELGMYYHKKLQIALKKFRVIPNFMPKWWGFTPPALKTVPTKRKLRIGFPCSASHFNLMDNDTTKDDFIGISDFIRATVDKYEWVFFGSCPKHLWDLLVKNKISVTDGSDFLNYLNCVKSKNLDVIVAPLEISDFNKCKSNIKLLESASCQIPFIGQDICTYNKYTKSVFSDGDSLQKQLDRIFESDESLNNEINNNNIFMDNDTIEDRNRGWWLENNLHYHTDLFKGML